MKKFHIVTLLFVFIAAIATAQNQEKKIKFNKGTLKICSAKNFVIKGYDGKEVIIKSLHSGKSRVVTGYTYSAQEVKGGDKTAKIATTTSPKAYTLAPRGSNNNVFFTREDHSKKEGLKRLGKKQEDRELGIFFTIEQSNGELLFKDTEGQFMMFGNEHYEIKVPNTVKLKWDTGGCKARRGNTAPYVFLNGKGSSLSDFNGEVEITTSLNNMQLTDVTGPVSINSIGGNVTVKFDKKKPMKLYSLYSNNGFIDITLPSSSDVSVDAKGAAIYSDIDFKVLADNELGEGTQHMNLKLKNGKVKMKLEAGWGTIYLRKKK